MTATFNTFLDKWYEISLDARAISEYNKTQSAAYKTKLNRQTFEIRFRRCRGLRM